MASKITSERYAWWRKQFNDDPNECCLGMEIWISGGLAALLALNAAGGDGRKKRLALAPFSSTIVERDDIVSVLTDTYASCGEDADLVAQAAYRRALVSVAQPLPLGRLDPEIHLIALEACTVLGFWELCSGLLRWPEQLFSLSGPLLRAVRTYAKSLHTEEGRALLRRLIAEAKRYPERDPWRYWTLVAALDQCANRDMSVQRTEALDLFFLALDVVNGEDIPELECQQITVALLYRMCPQYLENLTDDQATRYMDALSLLDYPTIHDSDVNERFYDYAMTVLDRSAIASKQQTDQKIQHAAADDLNFLESTFEEKVQSLVAVTRGGS